MKHLWRGFYLSVSLHLLLLALLVLIPLPERQQPTPVAFELVPREKTVVRDSLLPDSMSVPETDDPLRFLSEKNQLVRQQMRALQTGLTKNRSKSAQQKIERFLPDHGLHGKTSPQKPTASQEEQGVSTFGNIVPDEVKIGSITALNQERYLFYSYFSRAEDLIRNEWEPLVVNQLLAPPLSMSASAHRQFTTVLQVWFYPDGRLHSTHVHKPSGVPELDQAAVMSFRRIKIIPNPPRERVEKDGLIRFTWSLAVEYNPKVLVRQ